ncbi:MAG TPA: tetratricopeptide repeat protein, partial [Aggregatilineales bacterium]|nr:tetratricopeptide repeat protein [Aggregatilineales bacterium]
LSSTPKGSSDDAETAFTRYILNKRMADYYMSRRKPESEWKSIADLDPQIREIEYRYAIADYDTAATILIAISAQHLYYWGYMVFVIEWLLRIREHISDGDMKIKVTSQLGIGYWKLVNYEMSFKYSKMALEMAQAQGNNDIQAALVGNLAYFYYIIGQIETAIEYVRQGIDLSQETQNKATEAIQWGNLGAMYYSLGEVETALTYYQQGLTLSQEMGDKLNQSRQFVNLGEAMTILNRPNEAIPYLKESIQLAQEISAITLLQNNLMFLGRAYWLFGDLPNALDSIHQILALDYYNPEREHYITVLYGCLKWCMGHAHDSIEIFQKAIQIT